MKDTETKHRFIELRAKGYSYDRISKEVDVSKQTLINWSKEFECEILNLRAIQLEALQEKYFLTKEKRIEFLGKIINALQGEAEKRVLSDLSDRELFELLLKFSERLDKELTPITFQRDVESSITDIDLTVRSREKWTV
jgi:DNA-binding XRE family transcriptional regulator